MKRLLTLLTVMLLGGVAIYAADPITFTAGTDVNETKTITKDGITITLSDGTLSRTDNYRVYKNATITFSSSIGNISKVELTCESSNPATNLTNPTVGDYTDGVWTGNASEFSLTASVAQTRITKIEVTAGPTTKTVTFENDAEWAEVWVWAWNETDNFTGGEWPGVKIEPVDGVYTWSTTGDPAKIIFSNNGNPQTADLPFVDGATYNSKGRVAEEQDFSVTFETNLGWEKVYAYAWSGTVPLEKEWPGTEITETLADGKYTYAFKAVDAPANIIFNDGTTDNPVEGENKTADLTFKNGNAYTLNVNKIPNIAKLIALDDKTEFKFTGEALVVAKPTGKYVYIKDETGSSLIYDAGGEGDNSKTKAVEVGKTIAPNWTGKVSFYKVLFEAVPDAALTMKEGDPAEVTYPEVAADYVKAENVNQVVTINGLTITPGDGNNITFTLGDATIAGYNQFGIELPTETDGKTFDVVGAIGRYNDNIQFQPITIEEHKNTYTATFTTDAGWEKVCAYAWTTTGEGEEAVTTEFLGEWPGTELEAADGVYTVTIKAAEAPAFIIFNNGKKSDEEGAAQTEDIAFENGKAYSYELPAQTATFNFADPNFRENIGEAMADVKGFIYNETFTADGATLQITAGSAPSRIYVDGNRGQCLVIYSQYATMTFKAPEGKAITKIEFTAAGNSSVKKFTPSSGTIDVDGKIWTGNATGIRFLQGATSYLANAIVTLEDATEATTALPAIEYTKCEDIAAFNKLEAGTYAELTLTDAEVIGKSADGYSTVFIQDATGGAWIQYTSLNDKLQEKTKLNGTIYAIKRATSGNPQLKEAEATVNSEFTSTEIDAYTIVEGTIDEVNVAENLNKVVKINGATLAMTSDTSGTLTLGESTIAVNNGAETANQQLHKIADWAKDTKLENVNIVAILVATSATDATKNQLLPISIEVVPVYNLVGCFETWTGEGENVIKEEVTVEGLFATKWDAENAEDPNVMVYDEETGNYTLSFTNIELPGKGNILYKVVKNHSWAESYGTDTNENCYYWVNEAGKYDITFTLNLKADTAAGNWLVSCNAVKSITDGIANIKAAQENGAAIYTLQGVRVNNVKKGGMYIVNGKKVAIK